MDFWQKVLFGGAALIVLMQMWRGWRLGVVRQLCGLLAIAGAYAAAYFGRESMVSVLAPLGLPDHQLALIGAAGLGIITFLVVTLVSALLFKKTADQSVGLVRFGYGLFGSLIGGVKGLVIVWIAFILLRLVGTVAEEIAKTPASSTTREVVSHESNRVQALAQVKEALNEGAVGAVMDRLDPVPDAVNRTLPKVVRVFGDEGSAARFSQYPGTQQLMNQPKLIELSRDPEIAKASAERNFAVLLKNERIRAALYDGNLKAALQKFEFEKALDYALDTPENTRSAVQPQPR